MEEMIPPWNALVSRQNKEGSISYEGQVNSKRVNSGLN